MSGIVTFTTDFGLRDGYVGALKGALLSLAPDARAVDISHLVKPQDVEGGAFVLHSACHTFPAGTVHVAVVDPGVGSGRRGLIVETRKFRYVGPDNGLFSPVFVAESDCRIVSIQNPDLRAESVSATFHGRDVFAPAAAHLLNGEPLEALGPEVTDPVRLDLWEVAEDARGLTGRVVHVDHFGNAVTWLSRERIQKASRGRPVRIEVRGHAFGEVRSTYSEVASGEPLAVFGSQEALEISINTGNASRELGIERGEVVRVTWSDGG